MMTYHIEIRSVNHRYLEPRIRLPRQFKCFENELINQTKSAVSRGKLEIDITLKPAVLPQAKYSLNQVLWQNVCELIRIAGKHLDHQINVTLSDLFNVKDLLVPDSAEIDLEAFKNLFNKAIDEGMRGLIEMREREGQLLTQTILQHLVRMETYLEEIEKNKGKIVDKFKQKLQKNITQIAADYDENDPRILQEIGLFLDKSDITEEIERLNTHFTHFRELLDSNKAIGRKLDFLLQEFNREANTLCSKANHTKIARCGVELKCEIEKLREQVQNIE